MVLQMENLIKLLKEINNEVDYYKETDLVNNGIFTSLEIIQCMTEIEQEFNIRIPPQEVIPENFKSLDQIWKMIIRVQESVKNK